MTISRRQDEEEELRDSLPYHWLKGLAENERENQIEIVLPTVGPGRRSGEYLCRCPACDYEMSVEEGQKCELIECPICRSRMRGV